MEQEERALKSGLEFDVGQEQEIAHSHPDLSKDSVFGSTQKRFDFKVLFDPFEEQLHVPACLVDFGNGHGRQLEIISQEFIGDAACRVKVTDQPQGFDVFFVGLLACEFNRAVKKQAVFKRDIVLSGNAIVQVIFGAGHKEGSGVIDPTEPVEVDIAPVDHIDAVRDEVQKRTSGANIRALPIGHDHKGRDLALKLQLAMEFDRAFGLAELGPGEQFQTQVDGGGIKSAHGILKPKLMIGSDGLAALQQAVKEFFHDSVISLRVGFRQRGTLYSGEPQVVELGLLGPQSGLDVPQAVLAAGLSIEEGGQLIPGGEFFDVSVPKVLGNCLIELMSG